MSSRRFNGRSKISLASCSNIRKTRTLALENLMTILMKTKQNRLSEIINLQQKHSLENYQNILVVTEVLIEKESKNQMIIGLENEQNIMVVFKENLRPGSLSKCY